ncbi:MAG: hypothetical protein JXR33_04960 [Coriobacteriia bacterium]|nr:hypothetical protein [Coriobacteriia bacterium]
MVDLSYPQAIVSAGLVAFVLFIAAMPVGSRLGRSAGRRMLRGTLAAFLIAVVVSTLIASGNGEIAALQLEAGPDALLQIGAFTLMVLFTTYFFASRYLDDLDR